MFVTSLIAQKVLGKKPDDFFLSEYGQEIVFDQESEVQLSEFALEICLDEV